MNVHSFSILQKTIWLISAAVFLLHQWAQKYAPQYCLYTRDFLDVFLFPIILLPLLLAEQRAILKEKNYRFPMVLWVGYTAVLIIISELIFPFLSSKFTRDPLDALMIAAGSLLFYWWFNRAVEKEKPGK